ncbi:hypothetical protein GQ55_6G012700 [Panicum hallii var. hallii]|uniref:Uncharacterized protein n=1 Tax=Panicum hallii var. hallii TaxID=1504633 RepID=A0A2T7D2Q5_9POAL|nr:hypothetical protein GQ55_6G012700 [Panicum hallii var. hallii]
MRATQGVVGISFTYRPPRTANQTPTTLGSGSPEPSTTAPPSSTPLLRSHDLTDEASELPMLSLTRIVSGAQIRRRKTQEACGGSPGRAGGEAARHPRWPWRRPGRGGAGAGGGGPRALRRRRHPDRLPGVPGAPRAAATLAVVRGRQRSAAGWHCRRCRTFCRTTP